MKAIKERFLYCLVGATLCVCAVVFCICNSIWHAGILLAVCAVILSAFTVKASESYRSAKLICENPILNVGVASVSETGGSAAQGAVNVIVSGFGVLMDEKPYKFGHGGVELAKATIDRENITLAFGGEDKAYSVCLLHGVALKADIDALSDRLRYETGVVAEIIGW